jgi:hypothetical protein
MRPPTPPAVIIEQPWREGEYLYPLTCRRLALKVMPYERREQYRFDADRLSVLSDHPNRCTATDVHRRYLECGSCYRAFAVGTSHSDSISSKPFRLSSTLPIRAGSPVGSAQRGGMMIMAVLTRTKESPHGARHPIRKSSTISKAELDAALIYVDCGRRQPEGCGLADNHILHASMDEVEQIFTRTKRRSLRMSAALGLAIGFASSAIAIHLAISIGLLTGYVRP